MAGTFPSPGGGERFRDAITFVQEMAAPPNVAEQATFYFPNELVYTGEGELSADGVPFDPDRTVQRVRPAPVRVPCSITYYDRQGEITNLGIVTPTNIAVDLLDVHHEQVRGCEFVVVGGDKYVYRRTEPPSGLFDVGIYTLRFDAENET
jgi:hypothetical protein